MSLDAQQGLQASPAYGQESGSGTFLRAPLHGIVPAGLVDLPRVTLRTASGKKEPDPGPLNTSRMGIRDQRSELSSRWALRLLRAFSLAR